MLIKESKLWRSLAIDALLLCVTLNGQTVLNAQTTASGFVCDETGEAVVGCLISVKGNEKVFSTTDLDGKFMFEVPTNSILHFSMLGMQDVEAPAKHNMDIVLRNALNTLDDVVVVGYGTQKRATLTGAISNIDNAEIVTTKSPSLAVSLAGKVPGLRIRQANGMPGDYGWNDINIRGLGSPIIVIDGVMRPDKSEFQKLSADDIESVTVLKDASASLYGMNSSNGAIIVTTKSGSSGPLKVSFKAALGLQSPTAHMPMMSSSQYWEIRNENEYWETGSPLFNTRESLENAMSQNTYDWYDEVFKKAAFNQEYNIMVEGGNNRMSTYTNIGYLGDTGLLKSGDIGYNKFSVRNGTKYKINDYLRFDINLYGYSDKRYQPGGADNAFYFLNKAVHAAIPSEPVYANDNPEYYNRPNPLFDNPLAYADRDYMGYSDTKSKSFQGVAALTLDIPQVQGLWFKAQFGYDYNMTNRVKVQKNPVTYRYEGGEYKEFQSIYSPYIKDEEWNTGRWNFQASANYKRTFAEAHNVSASAIYEMREYTTRYIMAQRNYEKNLFTNDIIDSGLKEGMENGGNTGCERFVSAIGRFNYDYKERYLVEFGFRADGSYRYKPEKRWGFFPMVSAGWRISEEPFVKNNVDFITNLKLRASWGRAGEDAANAFQWITGYVPGGGYVFESGRFTNGYENSGIINQALTWVETESVNIGFDLSLWNGKLDFSADVFSRSKTGLLAYRSVSAPNTFGGSFPQENLNSDLTRGFEFMIGHKNTVGDFSYGVNANLNFSRYLITYQDRAPFRSSWEKWKWGLDNRYFDGIGWVYQMDGQYQDYEEIRNGVIETGDGNIYTLPGDFRHKDINGDGVINENDMMPISWQGAPKVTYGLTFYASWKGIDFNMLWSGAGLYTMKYNNFGTVLAGDFTNSPSLYYDRWHKADLYDPDSGWIAGEFPAPRHKGPFNGSNGLDSDFLRVDASYIRLKNVEIGYTVPKYILKKALVSNLRVYFNMTNPLIICNKYLKYYDPEVADLNGGGGWQYPIMKTYTFGVNVSF